MNSMNFSRAGKFNKPGNFKKKKDLKAITVSILLTGPTSINMWLLVKE